MHPVLRAVTVLELLTLAVLLTNVALLHQPAVAAAVGPVHGGAYLAVIIALLVREGTPARTRALAVVPGVGGLLALRAIDRDERAATR